jgi:hypothetical protein
MRSCFGQRLGAVRLPFACRRHRTPSHGLHHGASPPRTHPACSFLQRSWLFCLRSNAAGGRCSPSSGTHLFHSWRLAHVILCNYSDRVHPHESLSLRRKRKARRSSSAIRKRNGRWWPHDAHFKPTCHPSSAAPRHSAAPRRTVRTRRRWRSPPGTPLGMSRSCWRLGDIGQTQAKQAHERKAILDQIFVALIRKRTHQLPDQRLEHQHVIEWNRAPFERSPCGTAA